MQMQLLASIFQINCSVFISTMQDFIISIIVVNIITICLFVEADVMVNRVTKDMKLDNDRNSQALDYAAGPELKGGLHIAGGILVNQIIQTDGFNLACESLYHVTLSELDEAGNYINVSICCPFIP